MRLNIDSREGVAVIYIYINEEALLGEVSKKEINDIFGRKTERNTVDFALFGLKMPLFGGKGKVRKKEIN